MQPVPAKHSELTQQCFFPTEEDWIKTNRWSGTKRNRMRPSCRCSNIGTNTTRLDHRTHKLKRQHIKNKTWVVEVIQCWLATARVSQKRSRIAVNHLDDRMQTMSRTARDQNVLGAASDFDENAFVVYIE
jgi:hypothetical protein